MNPTKRSYSHMYLLVSLSVFVLPEFVLSPLTMARARGFIGWLKSSEEPMNQLPPEVNPGTPDGPLEQKMRKILGMAKAGVFFLGR